MSLQWRLSRIGRWGTAPTRRMGPAIACAPAVLCLLAAPSAHAQFAVIDVGAIAQLLEQAKTLQQQLLTAQNALQQAQTEYASITGTRGMERLLADAPRNYLPTSWTEIQSVLSGSAGGYGGLAAGVAMSVHADAVLSPQQIAMLPASGQQQIGAARSEAALAGNVARQSLQVTSGRFSSLQQLIGALPLAVDQKAVLELQARIAAENAMLQNEQTKLQTLDALMRAEVQTEREQAWERSLAGHGQFSTRFEPAP